MNNSNFLANDVTIGLMMALSSVIVGIAIGFCVATLLSVLKMVDYYFNHINYSSEFRNESDDIEFPPKKYIGAIIIFVGLFFTLGMMLK